MPELGPDEAAILDWLRSSTPTRRGRPPAPARRTTPIRPRRPKPNTIAEVLFDGPDVISAEAAENYARRWASLMLEPKEVRAWLDAGVRASESRLVGEFISHGLTPRIISTGVHGDTLLGKLRIYGYSVENLVETARNAGLLDRTA